MTRYWEHFGSFPGHFSSGVGVDADFESSELNSGSDRGRPADGQYRTWIHRIQKSQTASFQPCRISSYRLLPSKRPALAQRRTCIVNIVSRTTTESYVQDETVSCDFPKEGTTKHVEGTAASTRKHPPKCYLYGRKGGGIPHKYSNPDPRAGWENIQFQGSQVGGVMPTAPVEG